MNEFIIGAKGVNRLNQKSFHDLVVLKAFYKTNIKGTVTTTTQALGYIKVDIGAVQMLQELLEPQSNEIEGSSNE